jgi:hypothetical protein
MPAAIVPPQQPVTDPPAATPQRRGTNRDRTQLLKMQQTLFELTQDKSVMPHIRAACARAWSDLQERKRVLDGKPLPGILRPDLEQPGANKRRRQKMPSVLPLPEVPSNSDSVRSSDSAKAGESSSVSGNA